MSPRQRPFGPLLLALALTATAAAGAEAPAGQQTPPPGGPPKDFALAGRHAFTLPNGLAATLVPFGSLPKATVSVRVRTGHIDEAADEVWLADLTARMLAEGTERLDAEQLATTLARMGGTLDVATTLDGTFVTTDVLAENAADAVGVLADVVRRPALPESELARLRADLVRELNVALSQPQPIADQRFAALLYPDHPYGRLYPGEAMLSGYTIDKVRGHWRENFGAQRTRVFVAGRFDPVAVERAIRGHFGDWASGPVPTRNVPAMRTARRVHVIDRPGAVQSTVRIGLPVLDPSRPDYVAFTVTNALLGGMFSSRITSNIREDKGYTYSPGSEVAVSYRAAHWVEEADVTTEVTGPSLREIFLEIDRLQAEPPSETELDGVKNYLAGVFVLQNSSRNGIIGQLWFLDLHDLPEQYLTGYVKSVYAVTPGDVQRLAASVLRDGEMTIVVVGDNGKIREQVAAFGEIAD